MIRTIRVVPVLRLHRIDNARQAGENGGGIRECDDSPPQYSTTRSAFRGLAAKQAGLCPQLMTLRTSLKTLLGMAIGLPIIQSVLIGLRYILLSMGDEGGAAFIVRVGHACLALWLVTLVGLLVVTAVVVISEKRTRDGER